MVIFSEKLQNKNESYNYLLLIRWWKVENDLRIIANKSSQVLFGLAN
jgi:hypothetical protein